jgi:hypothetical protein
MDSAKRDLTTSTDVIEPAGDALPSAVLARARRTVALYAKDADDCRMLLIAPGLAPDDVTGQGPAEPR